MMSTVTGIIRKYGLLKRIYIYTCGIGSEDSQHVIEVSGDEKDLYFCRHCHLAFGKKSIDEEIERKGWIE